MGGITIIRYVLEEVPGDGELMSRVCYSAFARREEIRSYMLCSLEKKTGHVKAGRMYMLFDLAWTSHFTMNLTRLFKSSRYPSWCRCPQEKKPPQWRTPKFEIVKFPY